WHHVVSTCPSCCSHTVRLEVGSPCAAEISPSSSRNSRHQAPATRYTLPPCTCAANGSARISFAPVTRSANTRYPARLRMVDSALSLPPDPGSCSTPTSYVPMRQLRLSFSAQRLICCSRSSAAH